MWHRPTWWQDKHDWRAITLTPVGMAWQAITRHRLRAQAKTANMPVPVICVGNIVAGGSGKTPLVRVLSELLSDIGHIHAVTRGYGGTITGPHLVMPDHDLAAVVGDEALEIAAAMPCWVARRRQEGILAAHAAGAACVLMDDGLQNPTIRAHINLLVVDAAEGFGNGLGIPAGPLREHPKHIWPRIDAVIITGASAESARAIVASRLQIPDHMPVFTAVPVLLPAKWHNRYLAFAGIGRPEKFFSFLEENNITVCNKKNFPDHYPYSSQDIETLRQMAQACDARLITTRKDILRLTPALRQDIDVADITLRLSDADSLRSHLHTLIMTRN